MTESDHAADETTDAGLIADWLGGDERAATALVTRHANPLARFVASQGFRGDVQEMVQDTFVRAFGSLESFRGDSAFRTWLFTIARRLILDARRAERRRRDEQTVEENDAVSEYNALDGLIANESEQKMRDAIARLSPTQREVFRLRVSDGLSYKEIAEVAETSEGAARVHYHNALRIVKESLYV